MTDIDKNLNLFTNDDTKEEEENCKIKCSHELNDDIKDENEHLEVVDAVSVCTELEQLFNDFNIYNHHIKVFKKLLNLKELKNQFNFFAFNQNQFNHNNNSNQLIDDLSSTLFKGGELSAMQVHSQLNKIKEQFKESQLLVTCLVHNLQRLRKNYCGTALDLVSSSELIANLERNHNNLKTCKSIFKYQCSEKRKQLNKLKQQLKLAKEDWNQLIVKEPTITKLTNEELLLLNKAQKNKRKSIDNQLDKQINNELNNEIDKLDEQTSLEEKSSSNLSSSSEQIIINRNQDQLTGESNCDSAVHSESEADSLQADSLQQLATAIFRRKSKLDRLERECYSFMSRLANRNKPINNEVEVENEEELNEYENEQFNEANLVIDDDLDNFNDYDEDLLDEEYDDVEFDDEIINDPFVSESDIERLINRFTNVQQIDNVELINQNLLLEDEESAASMDNLTDNLEEEEANFNEEMNSTSRLDNNDTQNVINNEIHLFTDDYLIGQARANSTVTENYLNENLNEIINNNELNEIIDQNNQNNQENEIINNNEISTSSSLLTTSALASTSNIYVEEDDKLSNNSLDSLVDNLNVTKEEALAETGEPLGLCKLRRKAVNILASRIRTEKQYYEEREIELKQKLENLQIKNLELEKQLNQLNKPQSQLILLTTAFVFCSLIGYFFT